MLSWKGNWEQTQQRFTEWWNQRGLVVFMTAQRPQPRERLPRPATPQSMETRWLDPNYRVSISEYLGAQTEYLAESFPFFDTQIGPGSLGLFLGAGGELAEDTVWYSPCIPDPDSYGRIQFNPHHNLWLERHLALVDEGLHRAQGRYLVGIPDLIENLDTLAALRGDTPLLYDLIERPDWVVEKVAEINQAFFEVYDLFYKRVSAADGSCCFGPFCLWGPGKTAKLQCDISATISPRMFRQFVLPALTEQCSWLDFAMYHLDGTTCLQHLDQLLDIQPLKAIEWTPQAGRASGGSPEWYDLYRRIKAGGKSVQVIEVADEELIPLLDAIGPQGTYILMRDTHRSLDQAEKLLHQLEPYYA